MEYFLAQIPEPAVTSIEPVAVAENEGVNVDIDRVNAVTGSVYDVLERFEDDEVHVVNVSQSNISNALD